MKSALYAGLLFLSLTLSLRADDDAITADSTADQVSTALRQRIDKIVGKYQNTMANVFPDDLYFSSKSDVDAAASEFYSANPKVLVDVLNDTHRYDEISQFEPAVFLRRQTLFQALLQTAKDANLPDLLASHAPEAVWVVTTHPAWYKDPAVLNFLEAQLGDISSSGSEDRMPDWLALTFFPTEEMDRRDPEWKPSMTWQWSVLNLASKVNDPAAQKALADTIQHAIDNSDGRPYMMTNALDIATRSNNPQIYTLSAGIMTDLVRMVTFPVNRTFNCVRHLVEHHPDLLKDDTFDKSAINFLKATIPGMGPDDTALMSRLGDSDSFGYTLGLYFGKDPLPFTMGSESELKNMKREFTNSVEQNLIGSIVYTGKGDKMSVLKDHYHSAIFQEGHWILIDPDDPTSQPNPDHASSPPPATPPTPANHSSPVPPVMAPPFLPPAVTNSNSVTASPAAPSLAPAPTPAASPAPAATPSLPASVNVTSAAPIEKLDASGQVTGVVSAVAGTSYSVVRVEGNRLVLKDASGNLFRLDASATNFATAPR